MTTDLSVRSARRMLHDIVRYAALLDERAAAAAAATPTSTGPARSSAHPAPGRLPHGLDRILDDTDQGPTGIRTSTGVEEILGPWARQIADDTGHPAPPATAAAAAAYIDQHLEWAHAHLDDWAALTSVIHETHTHLANRTGYATTRIGRCPKCGGHITTAPTRRGIPDYGSCDTCDTWYPDQAAVHHARRARLTSVIRNTKDPGIYVDWETLSLAYPTLAHDTLRKWVTRGHIPTLPGGHYQVAAINTRMEGTPTG